MNNLSISKMYVLLRYRGCKNKSLLVNISFVKFSIRIQITHEVFHVLLNQAFMNKAVIVYSFNVHTFVDD